LWLSYGNKHKNLLRFKGHTQIYIIVVYYCGLPSPQYSLSIVPLLRYTTPTLVRYVPASPVTSWLAGRQAQPTLSGNDPDAYTRTALDPLTTLIPSPAHPPSGLHDRTNFNRRGNVAVAPIRTPAPSLIPLTTGTETQHRALPSPTLFVLGDNTVVTAPAQPSLFIRNNYLTIIFSSINKKYLLNFKLNVLSHHLYLPLIE